MHMESPLELQIRELVQPIAEELGVDVLRVRVGSGGSNRLVQVIVDRAGGVDADALASISRGLSLQMDAEDLIAGRYRLEISSPGLDWALESAADFQRYAGEWLLVLYPDGRRLEGWNRGMEGDVFCLEDEAGVQHHIALADTARVQRAINWKAMPKGKK